MSRTYLVRMPKKDVLEIKQIQMKLDLPFPSAYQLWKKQKFGIKWEEF